MKQMLVSFVACVLTGLCLPAVAANVAFSNNKTRDPTFSITNDVNYATPIAQIGRTDNVRYWGEHNDLIVNVPEGVTFAPIFCSNFYLGKGHQINVNVDGIWCMTNSTVDCSSYPYPIDAVGLIALAPNGSYLKYGPYRLADGTIVMTKSSDGLQTSITWNGDFNFIDPNGKELPDNTLYINNGVAAGCKGVQNFTGGSFRAPAYLVYGNNNNTTNELNFTGGRHFIQRFTFRNRDSGEADAYDRTRISVSGAETVLKLYALSTQSSSTRYHGYSMKVTEGGTFELTGSVVQRNDHAYGNFLFDGGNLVITNQAYADCTWSYPRIAATNAVFTMKKAPGISSPAFKLLGAGNVCLTNTTFNAYSTMIDTEFEMEGGSFTAGGATTFGNTSYGKGTSTFRNATVDFGSGSVTVGAGGDHTLVIDGTTAATADALTSGNSGGITGTIDVRGGSLAVANNLVLGNIGTGKLKVSGGTVTAKNLYSGYNDATNGEEPEVEITGGSVSVSGNMDFSLSSGCKNVTAKVLLLGGTLFTPTIKTESRTGCTLSLVGNGGTLVVTAENASLLSTLTKAEIGAQGLTISSDCDLTIPKGFTNLSGEEGVLTLAGSGTKTLSAADTTVSTIVVTGGTLVFADGAKAASTLVVKNGAKVKFAGDPADVGLTGFVCGDATSAGVIALAHDQTLAVAGNASITNVQVELLDDFALNTTSALVSVTGTLPAESRQAWQNARVSVLGGARYAYDCFVTDGEPVLLKMSVAEYSRRIVVDEGASSVTEDIAFGPNGRLLAEVAAGASLTLSGAIGIGALEKRGTGRLDLTGSGNTFLSGLTSWGGIFQVPNVLALGYDGLSPFGFTLKGGTFAYAGADETYAGPFTVDAGARTSVVVRTDGALTLTGFGVTSGDLIKMGAGCLTLQGASNATVRLSADDGTCTDGWDPKPTTADFPADGTGPTGGYKGLNVGEGELLLKGDATTTFDSPAGVMLGLKTTSGTGKAALTVDGCKASFGKNKNSYLHLAGYQGADTKGKDARFTVRNGADVTVQLLNAGRSHDTGSIYPTTTVTRATLRVNSWRGSNASDCRHRVVLRDNARLLIGSAADYGPTYFDVENSTVAKNEAGDCYALTLNSEAGRWRFGTGSTLALGKITAVGIATAAKGLRLTFDGGTWKTGGEQTFRLSAAETYAFSTASEAGLTLPVDSGKTLNVARAIAGAGGVIKTGAGTLNFETQGTWDTSITTKTPLEDPVSLAFEGTLDVREGAVTIDATACRTGGAYKTAAGTSVDFGGNALGAATFAGAGSFANGAAAGAVISAPMSDDGTVGACPSFTDMTLTGVRVDFGRTEPLGEEAEGLVVATFPNGAPNVAGWRSRHTGKGTRATFRVADNGRDVLADVATTGFLFLVR